jgi:hypothetical protein
MVEFVDCEREQPFPLSPDLRDWIPEADPAHLVIEAAEGVDMGAFKVDRRGPGSAQYHPRMMLALLISCYAGGIFLEPSARAGDGAHHIAYLSKYPPETDPLYQMADAEVVDLKLKHLARMSPDLHRSWVLDAHVWRALYSQPIVERAYSSLIPATNAPIGNLLLASMAQVHAKDRGTNYALRDGCCVAHSSLKLLADSRWAR